MERHFMSDEELKLFISENVITTMEVVELLNCSRQNFSLIGWRRKFFIK